MTGYNSPMHRKSRDMHRFDKTTRTERKKDRIQAMITKRKEKQPTHPTLRENIFSAIKKKAVENKPEIQQKGGKSNPFSRFVKKVSGRFKKGDK